MNKLALDCTNLTKVYGGSPALSGLNLEVREGEVLTILGPSGCGKTTALRLIAGFDIPDEGDIEVGGRLVSGQGTYIPPERRNIGMVFQDYALFPHLTVEKNVAFGLPKGQRWEGRMRMILSMTGLIQLRSRMPHQLSGGEQQRVALARALAPDPTILLLDEPFSNLDSQLRVRVREEVREILKISNTTALFVTHDQEEALYMGDRVAVLNDGRLEQVGNPEAVYHRPITSFVARVVGQADFLSVTYFNGEAYTEMGALCQNPTIPPQQGLEVMVRPHDIIIEQSKDGTGRIISKAFQGAYTVYGIVLNSGESVRSIHNDQQQYRLGTRVRVSLAPSYRINYFKDGRSISQ